jgi:hypothetical protein
VISTPPLAPKPMWRWLNRAADAVDPASLRHAGVPILWARCQPAKTGLAQDTGSAIVGACGRLLPAPAPTQAALSGVNQPCGSVLGQMSTPTTLLAAVGVALVLTLVLVFVVCPSGLAWPAQHPPQVCTAAGRPMV